MTGNGFFDAEGAESRIKETELFEKIAACIKGGSTFDQEDRMDMAREIVAVFYEGLEQAHTATSFQMLMDAYIRGYRWRGDNPDSGAYLHKAAYDYADKKTSPPKPNHPNT